MFNDNSSVQLGYRINKMIMPMIEKDESISLWEIVSDYERGRWKEPLHQRKTGIWSLGKKKEWIYRLRLAKVKPVGTIVTYQIDDGLSHQIWINDGLQRIFATAEYKNNYDEYGDSEIEVEDLLKTVSIPVQHRVYASHIEAARDFQRLNYGTMLTAKEFFNCDLCYMDGYEIYWRPLLEELHSMVKTNMAKVVASRSKKRTDVDKYIRSNYGLFYRFLSEDIRVGSYGTHIQQPKLERKYSSLESKLAELLKNNGIEKSRNFLSLFEKLLERETSLIETIWDKVKRELGGGDIIKLKILEGLYRHLIDVSILKRNMGISNDLFKTYIEKIMIRTKGKAAIDEDSRHSIVLGLNDLSSLSKICRSVEVNLLDKEDKSYKRDKRIPSGYDVSHTGNGNEVVIEPSGLNRSRGSRQMTSEEKEYTGKLF